MFGAIESEHRNLEAERCRQQTVFVAVVTCVIGFLWGVILTAIVAPPSGEPLPNGCVARQR